MQLEIYNLIAEENRISVSLEAICDSYSSLLWDIEFYQCGCFEVYIAASPQNVSIFQQGVMMHSTSASLSPCNWRPMPKRAIT
mgnify:CR=1 FL=1